MISAARSAVRLFRWLANEPAGSALFGCGDSQLPIVARRKHARRMYRVVTGRTFIHSRARDAGAWRSELFARQLPTVSPTLVHCTGSLAYKVQR